MYVHICALFEFTTISLHYSQLSTDAAGATAGNINDDNTIWL